MAAAFSAVALLAALGLSLAPAAAGQELKVDESLVQTDEDPEQVELEREGYAANGDADADADSTDGVWLKDPSAGGQVRDGDEDDLVPKAPRRRASREDGEEDDDDVVPDAPRERRAARGKHRAALTHKRSRSKRASRSSEEAEEQKGEDESKNDEDESDEQRTKEACTDDEDECDAPPESHEDRKRHRMETRKDHKKKSSVAAAKPDKDDTMSLFDNDVEAAEREGEKEDAEADAAARSDSKGASAGKRGHDLLDVKHSSLRGKSGREGAHNADGDGEVRQAEDDDNSQHHGRLRQADDEDEAKQIKRSSLRGKSGQNSADSDDDDYWKSNGDDAGPEDGSDPSDEADRVQAHKYTLAKDENGSAGRPGHVDVDAETARLMNS